MSYKIENFIGTFPEFFSRDDCDSLVKSFETLLAHGYGSDRQTYEGALKTVKDDRFVFAQDVTLLISAFESRYITKFNQSFWENAYPAYSAEYASLSNASGKHSIFCTKLQKTAPGGGYHIWHYESSNLSTSKRVLAFILYLNDVADGGETEFLYQRKRVPPTAGTLVIFPAAFTHTHRGNPPLATDKYILTGWVEFTE